VKGNRNAPPSVTIGSTGKPNSVRLGPKAMSFVAPMFDTSSSEQNSARTMSYRRCFVGCCRGVRGVLGAAVTAAWYVERD